MSEQGEQMTGSVGGSTPNAALSSRGRPEQVERMVQPVGGSAPDETVPSRCMPEQVEQMTGSVGGSTPNTAVPSRGRPEQVERMVQPVGGSAPDETVPSRWMPEQGTRYAAARGSRKKGIEHEAAAVAACQWSKQPEENLKMEQKTAHYLPRPSTSQAEDGRRQTQQRSKLEQEEIIIQS